MSQRFPSAGALGLLVGVACAAPAGADRAGTLVIASSADIGALSPLSASVDQDMLLPLTVPTVESGFDCGPTGSPGYAKSWSFSEDGSVLSMELRDDLTWEDGVPVTVDDLVFTFDLVSDPVVASPWMSVVASLDPAARPRVIDATHVEWRFTHAYDRATMLAHVGEIALVPRHVLKDVDRREVVAAHARSPLSYGPFRVTAWDSGERLVLTRNPAFRGPDRFRPALERIVWRVLPDAHTRLLALGAGEVDLVPSVSIADADGLRREHPEVAIARRGWRSTDYVAWNLAHPTLADRAVRAALAEAVDVDAIMARLHRGADGTVYALRAVGTITPALCAVRDDGIAPIRHDPTAARAHLAAAGWRDANGDGVLERGGERFVLSLLVNTDNTRMVDLAQLVQGALAEVGVRLEIERVTKAELYSRLMARKFDAAIGAWNASLFVDPSPQWQCSKEGAERPFNFTGYCDPEVDGWIAQGLATTDPARAADAWSAMQARIYADQPYLFLYWMDDLAAVRDRFSERHTDLVSPYGRLYAWKPVSSD